MASVLIEYVQLDRAGERDRNPSVILQQIGSPEILPEILDDPVWSQGAPSWGKLEGVIVTTGYARVTVLTGAVQAAWGGPDADAAKGLRHTEGAEPLLVQLKTGERLVFVRVNDTRLSGGARAELQQQGNRSLADLALAATARGLRTLSPAHFPSTVAPVAGVFNQSGRSEPFAAEPGRPINVTIGGAGPWSGTVRLVRRLAGEPEFQPLTMVGQPWATFTGPANEPVWEETVAGAVFALDCVHVSGEISYRIAQ